MSDDNKIALHDFAALVAKRAKVSTVEANTYIHQLAKSMSEELEAGGDIHLYHFGRFHTTHVDEQAGHDPNSGAPLTIPAHSRVHFRAYGALRLAVNAPFNQLRIRELTPDKKAWRTRTGFWILLLLVLLLILLGIRATSWVVPLDASPIPTAIVPAAPVTPESILPVAATTGFIVSPGDTLWGIAATSLGDPYWWPVIYAENRPELSHHNPDLIDSGITLRIPVLAGSVSDPDGADLRLRANGYQIAADDYLKLGNPRAAAYEQAATHCYKE
ncbi:HU family DNA-binding protein [Sideroxydans sp.]